jgi:hypothetical protein
MFFLLHSKTNFSKEVSKPTSSLVVSNYIKNLHNRPDHTISNLFCNFSSNNIKFMKKFTLMSDRCYSNYYVKIILFLLALFIQLSFLNNNVSAYNNEAVPVSRLALSLLNGIHFYLYP